MDLLKILNCCRTREILINLDKNDEDIDLLSTLVKQDEDIRKHLLEIAELEMRILLCIKNIDDKVDAPNKEMLKSIYT